ncbi:helix-turn-helix transcriptional regulator [Elioraea rosea]|uniref:helix-turn-helix transcriptional regulator n=1 Tax=Elioraea rosea TaxID=2492390 RepID=UPI001182E1DC|nr:WYL domain-containing protein [Elioraea rosea]
MHYLKLETILRLALAFQGTREGLSLGDIQREFSVGRRTAERMRDAVARVFPQFERCDQGERVRRWRLPQGTLGGLVALGAEELASIEAAAAEWRGRGLDERAVALDQAAAKLRAMARPEHLRRVEPDLEVLMEAEGSALRPGPRPSLPDGLIGQLRRAILACLPVSMDYRSRSAAAASRITVHPYGLLYGSRPLLVAAPEPWTEPRLYRLDRMSSLELGNIPFLRRRDFSLQDFATRAFGTFQEEPFEVTLRFAADTADEAAQWRFHPTQSAERDGDGRLIVRFRAGGAQEMCWHIFTWGRSVEILSPDGLRSQLRDLLAAALAHHA